VEIDGIVILKGNDGATPLNSVGITIKWTGTLWTLSGGQDYMFDMTITNVDGTFIENDGGTITKSRVDLTKVFVTFLDYEDTGNILKFQVNNTLSYGLNYKYALDLKYFNDL